MTQRKAGTRTRTVVRVCLALAWMTVLFTMTGQQLTQADEPVEPTAIECPNQLQSYWKLDENAGPTYKDFVGDNDALCNGPCPIQYDESGPPSIHGAQTFDATTRVDVAPNAIYDWSVTSDFSIEFWMRTEPNSNCQGNQVVIGRDADDAESPLHWWVGCLTGGAASFTLRDTDDVTHYATRPSNDPVRPPIDVTDGEWHHIVAVRLGNQGALRLYVDGVQEAGDPIADDYTGSFGSPTAPLNVGWLNYSWELTFHFQGEIDELAIYGRVLQPNEVAEHYARRGPYCLSPSIDLVKTASETTVYEGATVVYTYRVTNDGNENLGAVDLSDDTCTLINGPTGDTGIIGQLEVNETWTYTCSQTLYTSTTNTAIVTANGASGQVRDVDTETVTVLSINPSVTITKRADPAKVVSGGTVVYSYDVQNTGDSALTNVTVTDDKCSPVTGPQGSTLAAGATANYSCSQALTQTTTNTARVTADHPGGGTVQDTDSVTVDVINPSISLTKSASSTGIEPGETVSYTYTVRNNGDDILTNVTVIDDKCSPVLGAQNSTLAPGQSTVFTCSQVLNEPTTNTGTVTANDSLGNTVTATDSVTVRIGTNMIYLPSVFNQYP